MPGPRAVTLVAAWLLLATFLSASAQDRLFLYGGGASAVGEPVVLWADLGSRPSADLTVHRVNDPERVLAVGGPTGFDATDALDLSLVERRRLERGPDASGVEIRLEGLERGLYLAQLENEAATMALVTDLGMVVKTDEDTALAYTSGLEDGAPLRARVLLFRGDRLYAEGLADAAGLTEFEIEHAEGEGLAAAARHGDAWAFSEVWWSRWAVERYRVHLHTDRPVYRPGHTVHFKGIARRAGSLAPVAGREVRVTVRDADGTEVHGATYATDAYGSFHGEARLAAVPALGGYTIEASFDGETFYGQFQVLEYRRPEYRVSVRPEVDGAIQGQRVTVAVGAEYYFGGPVAGAAVDYSLIRQPYDRFRYRSSYGFYEEADVSYGGEVIERGEAVLGADGTVVLDLELPAHDEDYRLLVQAGVTDEARREIGGSAGLLAYRADLVLGVDAERYAYRTGEEARITVAAENVAGDPVALPVTVDLERVTWTEAGEERRSPWRTLSGRTGADGRVELRTTFEAAGSFRMTVTASDAQGRRTSDEDGLWIYGGTAPRASYGSLSVEADKPEYAVGETARIVIRSPLPDVPVLITREGRDLASYEVVRLEGSSLTYELPVGPGLAPNAYVSAVVVGGGEIHTGTAGFRVPPEDAFLNVEATSDSDVYRPGDEGTFTVRVSDREGVGVRAQLSLALVDEATLAIAPDATPDVRAFFHGPYWNAVGTDLSTSSYFHGVSPAAAALPAPMDEAVFGQGKGGFAEAEVREAFRDTALWLPTAETDDDGLATVAVTFPDDLTEWRLTVRAVTEGRAVGQGRYSVTTTLPVLARLAAPRFLVRGDEASLRVIGQSALGDAQAARLRLEAEGLRIDGPATHDRDLPAGGTATAEFDVAATDAGEARLTALVLTPAASDALALPLPVLPHGVTESLAWAGLDDEAWTFTLPPGVDPAHVTGELFLTPSLTAAVAPALTYLAGYPYGCTEQTMSRFLPSLLASRAGDRADLPEAVAARLDDYVAAGLRVLYDFQHADGGWGFWKHDASDPFISAYVVDGLLQAREAGYAVRPWVLERGLAYLEGAVTKDAYQVLDGTDEALLAVAVADAKAYAYLALARDGHDVDRLATVAASGALSPYGRALTVLAFEAAGRTVEAELHLDALLAEVVERTSTASWEPRAPRFAWSDDAVETTARALEAIARLRPDHPLVPKVVNWLLLQRRGGAWMSTKDTAAVVGAALALEPAAQAAAPEGIEVRLDGEPLDDLSATEGGALRAAFAGLEPGRHRLEITGAGGLYAGGRIEFAREGERFEPRAEGVAVTRTYEALTPRTLADGRVRYEPGPLGATAVGDYVLVTVGLRPDADLRYVLVNEPLPAGFEVVENDLALPVAGRATRYGADYLGWNRPFDGREVRDRRIDFYFARLAEPVTFQYLLVAETPGDYAALPTRAWAMYAPDVQGYGVADRLRVLPAEP